jgi:hypothetical protein
MVEYMKDPALGPTRAQNAFGVRTGSSRVKEFRNINNGMFSGPRPTYGRYSVSENAIDVLNRSKRNMDMR